MRKSNKKDDDQLIKTGLGHIPYNNLNIRKKIYLSKFRARALSNLPIQ